MFMFALFLSHKNHILPTTTITVIIITMFKSAAERAPPEIWVRVLKYSADTITNIVATLSGEDNIKYLTPSEN